MYHIDNNQPELTISRLLESCAYLQWTPPGSTPKRGTGYLIGPSLIATAQHVIDEEGVPPPEIIEVRLADEVHTARRIADDAANDCAVLRLDQPSRQPPLRLALGCTSYEKFLSVGFPVANAQAPLPLFGRVLSPAWPDTDRLISILVYSPALGGQGGSPYGFSGSPVMIDGVCVGHLKSIIPGDADGSARSTRIRRLRQRATHAQYGYVYVCPVKHVQALLSQEISCSAREKKTQRLDRPSVRSLLEAAFPHDADFDPFFRDGWPKIYQRNITIGMLKQHKVSILLDYVDLHALVDAVRMRSLENMSQHEMLLRLESP